jgi:hypothetical protein
MAFHQKASLLVEIVWISSGFSTELSPLPCNWCTDSGKKIHVVAAASCECLCVCVWVGSPQQRCSGCVLRHDGVITQHETDRYVGQHISCRGHQCRRLGPRIFHLLVEIVWISAEFSHAFSLIHTFILLKYMYVPILNLDHIFEALDCNRIISATKLEI